MYLKYAHTIMFILLKVVQCALIQTWLDFVWQPLRMRYLWGTLKSNDFFGANTQNSNPCIFIQLFLAERKKYYSQFSLICWFSNFILFISSHFIENQYPYLRIFMLCWFLWILCTTSNPSDTERIHDGRCQSYQ